MPTSSQRTLSPRALLAILTGLNLCNYLDRFVLSAVLPSLQKELHIGDGDAGRIATAFMLGYFVTSPIFGYCGDRYPRKGFIAAGIAVWSLGTLLTGLATGFAMLIAFHVLVGVGEASYATISPSLISDSYPPAKRNDALTIFYVAIPVGAALGNILGGFIGEHWGWRHAFVWAGAPGLLLALALLPFAEPKRGGADAGGATAHHAPPKVADVVQLLKRGRYLLVLAGYTAYTFAMGAFSLWGPSFLHRVHGVEEANAATFFGAVLVVAGLVGTLVGGFAATAWQRRNPAGYAWTLGLSVLAAVPVSFGAFLVEDRVGSMALLALAMFLLFLSTGPVNTLILELVPTTLRASAMTLSIFTIHLFGDLGSPEIVGRLSDAWGSLQRAVLVLPAALLLAAVFWCALAWRMRGGGAVPSPADARS